MSWQCPYSPLELLEMNPHQLDYDSRVILPDGTVGTITKAGYSYATVATDGGGIWKGKFTDLRPHIEGEEPKPRIEQLSLL